MGDSGEQSTRGDGRAGVRCSKRTWRRRGVERRGRQGASLWRRSRRRRRAAAAAAALLLGFLMGALLGFTEAILFLRLLCFSFSWVVARFSFRGWAGICSSSHLVATLS